MGINGGEWLVIALIAIVLVGPDKMPAAARTLGGWIRNARAALDGARAAVNAELDAAKLGDLDPRAFRDVALGHDPAPQRPSCARPSGPAPFDDEAT